MKNEPNYIGIDDEGNEIQDLTPTTAFQRELLQAVGRKYFQNATDKRKAEKLENLIDFEWTIADAPAGAIPPRFAIEFVRTQIAWARTQNAAVRYGVAIKYKNLISAIRNPDNWTRWLRDNNLGGKRSGTQEDRSGYSNVSDPDEW